MNQIVTEGYDPTALHRTNIAVANAVRDGVLGQTIEIQGKKYIQSPGWAMIANAFGFVVSGGDVRREGEGFVAKAFLKRMDNGVIVAEAEGYVDRTEPRWKTAAEYALRSMAQTRAASKVCKMALASCVPLMGVKNLMVTPAEEVPEGGFPSQVSQASVRVVSSAPVTTPAQLPDVEFAKDFAKVISRESVPAPAPAVRAVRDPNQPTRDMAIMFGKYKGQTIRQIAREEDGLRYLEWLSRQELKLANDGRPFKKDVERNEIIAEVLLENPENSEKKEGEDDLPF